MNSKQLKEKLKKRDDTFAMMYFAIGDEIRKIQSRSGSYVFEQDLKKAHDEKLRSMVG